MIDIQRPQSSPVCSAITFCISESADQSFPAVKRKEESSLTDSSAFSFPVGTRTLPPPSLSLPLFLLIPSPYVRRSLSLYPSPSLSFYIFIPLFPSPFLPLLLCPFHSIKKYFIYLYSHVTDSYNPIHIFIHTIHL